jgi:hypothetical protein
MTALWNIYYYYLHRKDEETEAQRSYVIRPELKSQEEAKLGYPAKDLKTPPLNLYTRCISPRLDDVH